MTTIHVTGASWYIAETAIMEPGRIRVYDFGYDKNTVCNIVGGETISCEMTIQLAKSGSAKVYVPLGTPKRNYHFCPDDGEFKTALSIVLIAGIIVALIGRA